MVIFKQYFCLGDFVPRSTQGLNPYPPLYPTLYSYWHPVSLNPRCTGIMPILAFTLGTRDLNPRVLPRRVTWIYKWYGREQVRSKNPTDFKIWIHTRTDQSEDYQIYSSETSYLVLHQTPYISVSN